MNVALALGVAVLAAGATPPDPYKYPLPPCTWPAQRNCSVQFVADADAVDQRDLRHFPRRYLELWDAEVRKRECRRIVEQTQQPAEKKPPPDDQQTCELRLAALTDYFNPAGPPRDDAIGVALEGGGSKAAPFALGFLAGMYQAGFLGELPTNRVRAISTVSGGSYAGSYLFNRLYDQHTGAYDSGTLFDWFNACVPSNYVLGERPLSDLIDAGIPQCGECRKDTGCTNDFYLEYRFTQQVWGNPDLLFLTDDGRTWRPEGSHARRILGTAVMLVPTLAMVPVKFVNHTVLRQPYNVAPSKWSYRFGLERQFGYTPTDWQTANAEWAGVFDDVLARNETRTLKKLGEVLDGKNAPTWIINATSPGAISLVDWLLVKPRDPVRLQFELGPTGYGSGLYGYSKEPPESPMRLDTITESKPMSIGDATLASGAFFDSNQVRLNGWYRLPIGASLHTLNLEWYSEIRNFNMARADRVRQDVSPWPLWALTQGVGRTTPYIHLQDGGNSENTGILPLLRRGYRTIVYAHATHDRLARFEEICHLKNQLELDGTYGIRSSNFKDVLKQAHIPPVDRNRRLGVFEDYLDELCTRELTLTLADLMLFGAPDAPGGASKLSRLFCKRIGYAANAVASAPCPEFAGLFPGFELPRADWPPDADEERRKALDDLFFRWPDVTLRLEVFREGTAEDGEKVLSTIYVAPPAIGHRALARQVKGKTRASSWGEYCALTDSERKDLKVTHCRGPDSKLYAVPGVAATDQADDIACIALAHVLFSDCASGEERPRFPQHSVISLTWDSSYTLFAAYYDLGRDWALRVRNTVCKDAADAMPPLALAPACPER